MLATDRMRELSESIRARAADQIRNFYGDDSSSYSRDRERYLDVIRRDNEVVRQVIEGSLNRSVVRNNITAIDSEQKLLGGIPERMHKYLMMSGPLRSALENDEIYGFGLHPDEIPKYDVFEKRLFRNGLVDSHRNTFNKAFIRSNDEPLTISERAAIRDTRDFMEHLLSRGIDPTDYPNPAGKIKG